MTIETPYLTWAVLGVLALWPIASVCKAMLKAQFEFEQLRLRHLETLARAREESIRLQTLARALGLQAGAPIPPFSTHPSTPPAPPRPPA